MKFFAVIGSNIAHSLSPEIFRKFSKQSNIQLKYGIIDLPHNSNSKLIRQIALSLDGINITAPFKQTALESADFLSDEVKEIQSTNLILRKQDKLYAYNTDTEGIKLALSKIKQQPESILITGAGGAARTVAYVCKKLSIETYIINRTYSKAKTLADKFSTIAIKSKEINTLKVDTIVNTVPDNKYVTKVLDSLSTKVNFIDAIYPAQQYSNHKNIIRYIDGTHWLIGQAYAGFKIFTGKECNLKDINLKKQITPRTVTINFQEIPQIPDLLNFDTVIKLIQTTSV